MHRLIHFLIDLIPFYEVSNHHFQRLQPITAASLTKNYFMKKIETIKKSTFLAVLMFTISSICTAQREPLNGSGKIITKTFSYTNFDKLELNDLDGKVK